MDVATLLGLSYEVDAAGNILVRKPATPGLESAVRVAVQSHIDMVCSKTADSTHNFDTDPILADISADGKWIQAAGTTLGADDGIGVASALALLEATPDVLRHGPLECLFTVEEETTMDGAINLAPAPYLKAQVLLNVDSEEDHCVCVGCAGGAETKLFLTTTRETPYSAPTAGKAATEAVCVATTSPATASADASAVAAAAASAAAPEDVVALTVSLSGFAGGHTGIDAASARANAIQVLARVLSAASDAVSAAGSAGALRLASISGGNAPNAIPRDATAVVVVPAAAATAAASAAAAHFTGIVTESLLPEAKAKLGEAPAGLYGAQTDSAAEAKELAANPERARALCGMRMALTAAAVTPVASAEAGEGAVWPVTRTDTEKIISLIQTVPHGVIRYSPEVAGDVDTSNALAMVGLPATPITAAAAAAEVPEAPEVPAGRHGHCPEAGPEADHFWLHCFYRSFSDFQLGEMARRLRAIATLVGAQTTKSFGYFNGWEPVMSSPLLTCVLDAHKTLFPALPAPQVYSVHAGLECGPIKNVYPDIHAVSIGPLSTSSCIIFFEHVFLLLMPLFDEQTIMHPTLTPLLASIPLQPPLSCRRPLSRREDGHRDCARLH